MSLLRNLWASKGLFFAVILLGIAARFIVSLRGHNYDFDSFAIVAGIADSGGNIYAGTTRYNYGPVWSWLLHLMYLAASRDLFVFRLILISLLTAADLGIFAVLYHRIGRMAACVFFLNPITIIITGYHNQFDNLALFAGMLAVLIFGEEYQGSISRRKTLGLLVLGLSLSIKHVLFAFPLWLAVKQKGLWQKAFVLLVPMLVFLSGFLPYWSQGAQGIIQNVFLYKSGNNEVLYSLVVPGAVRPLISSPAIWLILLFSGALLFRRKPSLDSLLFYTCILVAASPSMANQYLAIVLPFVAANLNLFTVGYVLVGSFYLSWEYDGLHSQTLRGLVDSPDPQGLYLRILVGLLSAGAVAAICSRRLMAGLQQIYLEIKNQLRLKARR